MYFKVQEHRTFCTFQSTKFSKEYEWEPEIMHLPLSDQRAGFTPAICSSSSYHLQSSISSLLLYVKDCFNPWAFPLNLSRVRTGNTLSQCFYHLSLRIRVFHWLTDCSVTVLVFVGSQRVTPKEVYFKNSSSCSALTYIKTLNWVNSYLLQCYQALATVRTLEEKSGHWITLHNLRNKNDW